ncbi:MAG TPA: dephospho-CoA kinase [bacterium]|nr:dephospho-CoA kinase [bacterium]
MVQKLNSEHPGKTLVGLTGGFGTGKTTVAHFFEELGAEVVDADKLAHEALMAGSLVFGPVQRLFPETVRPDGNLDLKKLAETIFHDANKRKQLEAIVHPYVFTRLMEEISDMDEPVVILDIPLLFETGYDQFCHTVIVVNAAEPVANQRLLEKGFSIDEIAARRRAQIPLEEKIKKAQIIIDNSGTFQQTRRTVEEIWKKLHPAPKGAV